MTNLRSLSDLFRPVMRLAAACVFATAIAAAASAQPNSLPPSGNVGVGTANPWHRLTVLGAPGSREGVSIAGEGNSWVFADLNLTPISSGIATGKPTNFAWSVRKDAYYGGDSSGPSLVMEVTRQGGGVYVPFIINPSGNILLQSASNATNGNVGIGTANPGNYKLNVNGPIVGTAAFTTYTADGLFGATALPSRISTYNFNGGFLFGYEDLGLGDYSPRLGLQQTYDATGSPNITSTKASIGLVRNGNITIRGGASHTEFFRIDNSGNVGIGTTSPTSRLHIGGTNDNLFSVVGTGSAASDTIAYFGSALGSNMVIRGNGNIGIGTASPGAKLHIASGDSSFALFGPNTSWGGSLAVGSGNAFLNPISGRAQVLSSNGNLHLDGGTNQSVYIGWLTPTNTIINGQGGNVRIGPGTFNSNYRVDVNGEINATGFLINGTPISGGSQWTNGTGSISYNGGNVGIGVGATPPASNLQIGNQTAGASATPTALSLGGSYSNSAGNNFKLKLYDDAQPANTYGIGVSWASMDFGVGATAGYNWYSGGAHKMTLNGSGNVGIGTTSPVQGKLVVSDTAQNASRLTLAGQEFYAPSMSSTDGVAFLLGVNRPGNKQLWIADSSALTQNSTNAAFRTVVSSGGVQVDAIGTDGVTAKLLNVGNSGGVAMTGSVGIGTNPTGYKLDVNGNTNVTGNLNATGTIEAGNIKAKYQDVAEWVRSSEQLSAGTVVVLDRTKSNQVIASGAAYDTRVAGVISAQPGITLGEGGEGKVLVATTGRVRVKVDASRGPIQIGDLLVTSEVPGVAMKSEAVNLGGVQIHRPGTIIGKALEPLAKGKGEILVLLSLQ